MAKLAKSAGGRPPGRWLGLSGPEFGGVELKASMAMLDMKPGEVAQLCGVTVRAVQLWLADERPIPLLVARVMRGGALGLVSIRALMSLGGGK